MSDDKNTTPPEAKEFSLKNNEVMMLRVFHQQHMVVVANFLTYIAIDRLAYPANEQTQYELSPDMTKVKVWQKEPEAKPEDKVKPVEKNTTAESLKGKN